ncbi:phosphonate C-P lyase system protein PhnL [Salinicoccus roseus]|uniref:Phosphonate ABC transporter ATP-binding protein n=1 Tax=Salinicoccus roseus TaxID=45670 RepID=A0A0C2HJK7_9STAP|nr:phosphonate C-P lyase system protein PhnL [Salinicoccus roseus]KIH69766.1 phosphonate ABC transporter ATP-binding protein [Salinicoccus roseus]MDB0579216.1 phosphonate C-P lyase system protein PhnL [Salinicoccus roseus]
MLSVENISKSFTIHHLGQTRSAISGINLHVAKGEFLGIVGKSGSGKSTILKSIYGTYKPEDGAIIYDAKDEGPVNMLEMADHDLIRLRKTEIGYVSQFLKVMPRTTSLELVTQSLLEMGEDAEAARQQAEAALRHFDIPESLWDNYPNTFSGGEKLRLNIARATVKSPRLLLLDEPTASLDNDSKLKVRDAIAKLKADGTTLIGIFHDLEFMEGLCDRVYDMANGKVGRM